MSAPASAPPPVDAHRALPVGQRLGELEIRSVLGVGGFGIVYHAFDHALERDVAVKEYMPGALAQRSDTLHVSVLSQGHAETFALGLRSFVNEARLLARFDHLSLVKVHRFWEANGTAYMAMPLYRGRTLKAMRLAMGESPSEAWLRRLLAPLLGALEVLHAEGVFHRDIAPDNILVGEDGKPVLLDFGAARRVIADNSQSLTAILKPSYAPVEQYAEAPGLRQGAWTDLYALGATLAFVITGVPPQPATARALGTDHHRLAGQARRSVSDTFLQIVDWMMAPRPEHRPQSVAALREVLDGRAAAPQPPPVTLPPAPDWERTVALSPAAEAPTLVDPPAVSPLDMPIFAATQPPGHAARPPRPAARPPRRRSAWMLAAAVAVAGVAYAQWRAEADAAPSTAAALAPAIGAGSAATAPPVPASAAALAQAAPPTPAAQPTPEAPSQAPSPAQSVVAAARPPAAGEPASAARPARPAVVPRVAATPVPVAAPVSTALPPTDTASAGLPSAPAVLRPRDQCQGRLLVALHRCLKRVCQDPAVTGHRDCQRMRQVEAANTQPSTY